MITARCLVVLALSAGALTSAAALTGCETTPKAAAPDISVIGNWRAPADGTLISFTNAGLYSMIVKDLPRPVVGSFDWEAATQTITLRTRRESPICSDDTGTYTVTVGTLTLDATVVRDTCEARKKIFARPLQRVPASTSTGRGMTGASMGAGSR